MCIFGYIHKSVEPKDVGIILHSSDSQLYVVHQLHLHWWRGLSSWNLKNKTSFEKKKLNVGSLAWVASDLQRRLPWLRLHQGPPLEITRFSQNNHVTLCYLGRVIFTLNWDLGWFMFSWWNVFTLFLVSLSTGRAPVFSPCGVAGGNPFGCWSTIIQAFLKELELGTAFLGADQ